MIFECFIFSELLRNHKLPKLHNSYGLGAMAFRAKWWLVGLALIKVSIAEPETVDGLMKKNQNTWKVPIGKQLIKYPFLSQIPNFLPCTIFVLFTKTQESTPSICLHKEYYANTCQVFFQSY